MRRRRGTAIVGIAAIALSTIVFSPSAGAQDKEWALLNDSPAYSFGSGTTPVRNAPLAVTALRGSKTSSGLELDITNVVTFVPTGTAISARIGFYSAPKRTPMVYGGVEFTYQPGTETVDGTLVERASEGTATTPEVWEPADEDFGDATIEYAGDFAKIRISATGAYRKLLRDPLTTVGLDLWTGAPGTIVQPSARVSIGDLTGAKPGLLPQQGTGVAADGTPQPWITRAVAKDFYKWKVSVSAETEDPQHVNLDIGKYSMDATQIRLLVANQLTALPVGSTFPPYDIILFAPSDTTATHRFGDAFLSTDFGTLTIKDRGKGKYALDFTQQLHAGFAGVHVVVPGADDGVLLATGCQISF